EPGSGQGPFSRDHFERNPTNLRGPKVSRLCPAEETCGRVRWQGPETGPPMCGARPATARNDARSVRGDRYETMRCRFEGTKAKRSAVGPQVGPRGRRLRQRSKTSTAVVKRALLRKSTTDEEVSHASKIFPGTAAARTSERI